MASTPATTPALISRVVAGTDNTGGAVAGFDAQGWTDPVIVADADGSGTLTTNDALLVAQASVHLPVPQIPSLPSGITLVTNVGGGSVALDAVPQTASIYVSSTPPGGAALQAESPMIPATAASQFIPTVAVTSTKAAALAPVVTGTTAPGVRVLDPNRGSADLFELSFPARLPSAAISLAGAQPSPAAPAGRLLRPTAAGRRRARLANRREHHVGRPNHRRLLRQPGNPTRRRPGRT